MITIYSLLYFLFLASPRFLNIKAISQNELEVVWSNGDNNAGVQIKFLLCYDKVGEALQVCRNESSSQIAISRAITVLQSATAYMVTVARYSKDEKTLGRKRQKAAISRSG